MDAPFRLKRSIRNQGAFFTPIFLAWAALTVWMAFHDPKIPHPYALASMASVPLFMAGLSIYVLLAYWRDELWIRDNRVTARGVFREKEIDFGDVISARWFTPNAAIKLRTNSDRLTIYLTNYEDEDRERIVRLLHVSLPREVQTGWNLFAYKTDFGKPRALRLKAGPDEVLIYRNHWNRYFLATFLLAFPVGIFAWRLAGEARFLAAPLLVLILWVVWYLAWPAEGAVYPKLSHASDPHMTRFLLFLLMWFSVAFAGVLVVDHFWSRMTYPYAVASVGAVVWFVIFGFEGHRLERLQRLHEHEAAELSAKKRGEPVAESWPGE